MKAIISAYHKLFLNNMNIQNRLHQYGKLIRWDKPAGTLLLLWPVLTALFLANHGNPPAKLTFIFVFGVFVMRAAGDIVNDLIDQHFDKHVARTQHRPLTCGAIKTWEALILLGILLIIALALVLQLNTYSIILASIGLILTFIYPFSKRWLPIPQAALAIVWSFGILIAFASSKNSIAFVGWFLFVLNIIWTIAYDTIYAICDKEDDVKLNLHSSAILFAENDKFIVAGFQVIIIAMLLFLGWLCNLNFWFYWAIPLVALSFIYQQWLIRNRDPHQCLQAFTNNHWPLFFIFFSVYLNFH